MEGFESLGSVKRLSGGASQETYRIEIVANGNAKSLAMRRAAGGVIRKPDPARPGLDVEAKLMQYAKSIGVPEPEIYYVLIPEDGLGSGFIMEWLEGETLGSRVVKSPELKDIRPKLAHKCGRILAKIHSIDPVDAGIADRLASMKTDEFVRQLWDQYKVHETPMPMIDYSARWLLENLPPDEEPKLVHNDYRNGNIMFSPKGVVAVLDWEIAHIGDPIRDIGYMCINSWRFGRTDLEVGGFGRLEDLLDGYEEESGRRVDPAHVHFWMVFGSFWWAANCLKMAEQWRNGPDRTVERPGIARRSSECQADCVNLLIPGPVELVEETEPVSTLDMPSVDELLISVRDFLRTDLRAEIEGRNNFMSLVASNSLDIVLRELRLAPTHLANEHERLKALLGSEGTLNELRWTLTNGLRDRSIGLDDPTLQQHLRTTVINQLAIDQPKYTALKTALDASSR
jgi:aminoglycoside phosphotransferase (APT) family kinase protein